MPFLTHPDRSPRPTRHARAGRLNWRAWLAGRAWLALACLGATLAACAAPIEPEPTAPVGASVNEGADTASGKASPATAAAADLGSATADPAAAPGQVVLPATVIDLEGATVTIDDVDRILSLSGNITEIIFALGLGERVVGVDISATYPERALAELPKVGYQRDLNAEGVLALGPTVILGTDAAGPPEALEQIRAAGVPVALTPDGPSLDAAAEKIRFVAAALGVPERGEELVRALEADLDAARARVAKAEGPPPRVLFLYLRGADTQMVAGSGTPADAMIQAAGAVNVAAEAGIEDFKPLSAEAAIAAAPELLLLLESGLESVGGVDALLALPGLAETPAGRERRVLAMDGQYLLGMGPRTGQALADLVDALHAPVESAAP